MSKTKRMVAVMLTLALALSLCIQGVALAADEEVEAAVAQEVEAVGELPVVQEDGLMQTDAVDVDEAVVEEPQAEVAADSFKEHTVNSGLMLEYTGNGSDVTFPNTWNGKTVIGVYGVATSSRQYVRTIRVQSGITTIHTGAFNNCTALTLVAFPASVAKIGSGVFDNCPALTSVKIPNKNVSFTSTYSQFKNCNVSKIYVHGVPGSQAEQLAVNNKTKFRSTVKVSIGAPKNLKVEKSGSGYNKVKITFDQSKYAHKYQIYRSTKKDSGFKVIKTLTAPSSQNIKMEHVDSVQPGRMYYYKVKALSNYTNPATASSFTNPRGIKPMLDAPYYFDVRGAYYANQTGFVRVNISWNKITGANGYIIYRSTDNKSYQRVAQVTGGSRTSFQDNSVGASNTYYYKMVAYRTVDGKNLKGNTSVTKILKRP